MADETIPFPRQDPEPWPQPQTEPRELDVMDGLAFLGWPARRQLFTMSLCGPSTEGQDVTIAPGVPIGVVATALLLLQAGDVATIECTEGES